MVHNCSKEETIEKIKEKVIELRVFEQDTRIFMSKIDDKITKMYYIMIGGLITITGGLIGLLIK